MRLWKRVRRRKGVWKDHIVDTNDASATLEAAEGAVPVVTMMELQVTLAGAEIHRTRAERAEAAARDFAALLRDIGIAPNSEGHLRSQIARLLAKHDG